MHLAVQASPICPTSVGVTIFGVYHSPFSITRLRIFFCPVNLSLTLQWLIRLLHFASYPCSLDHDRNWSAQVVCMISIGQTKSSNLSNKCEPCDFFSWQGGARVHGVLFTTAKINYFFDVSEFGSLNHITIYHHHQQLVSRWIQLTVTPGFACIFLSLDSICCGCLIFFLSLCCYSSTAFSTS